MNYERKKLEVINWLAGKAPCPLFKEKLLEEKEQCAECGLLVDKQNFIPKVGLCVGCQNEFENQKYWNEKVAEIN